MEKKLMIFIKKEEVCAIQEDVTKATQLLQKGYTLFCTTSDEDLEFSTSFEMVKFEDAVQSKPSKARRIWELVQEELRD